MALESGQTLLHYRLIEKIGEGGMGVVWKAVDTDLDREVAVKLLPEALSRDAERLARFQREAKLLAGLNHPNIATVHGLHRVDSDDGELSFLAMELIAGEDLSKIIERGALSVERAAAIGKQVAEALEVAHESGIVHRDLKPANILVTPDGTAKVLDFGLAKAAAESGDPDISNSPTLTTAGTQAGMILGTAAYLSPEQAKGQPVDRRTDIWAFGVVLHEMLSGKRTFRGEGLSETLAAVILKEPDLDSLPGETPPRVRELVSRCLTKDSRKRLRDIGEARIVLEDPAAESVVMSSVGIAAAQTTAPARRWVLPLLVALPLVALAAFLAGRALQPEAPAPRVMRAQLEISSSGNFARAAGSPIVLSPDGTRMVSIVGEPRQLRLRDLDSLESTVLTGTEGANQPFFSPDGEWIGFFANGSLKKISVRGGASLTLADCQSNRGGSWGPDDTIVYAPHITTGLFRIPAAGGVPEPLTEPVNEGDERERSHRWPHFLPDGRSVLFAIQARGKQFDDGLIAHLDLETMEHRIVHRGGMRPVFVAGGFLVFGRDDTLFASRFDPGTGEMAGTPVPVLEGVDTSNSNGGVWLTVDRDGTLFYVPSSSDSLWTGRTERMVADGESTRLGIDNEKTRDASLSPDGTMLAYTATDASENTSNIWLYDVERDVSTRLTFEEAREWHPTWTADGSHVIYSSDSSGEMSIYRKRADGSGESEALTGKNTTAWGGASISPDGQFLIFHDQQGSNDLRYLDLTGKGEPEVFLSTPARELFPVFSPDGNWVVYLSDESGRPEVYVRPFPGPGGKWQISRDGARGALWSPDGSAIYFIPDQRTLYAVDVTAQGNSFRVGRPREVLKTEFDVMGRWSIADDGALIATMRESEVTEEAARAVAVAIWNWPTELETLVPR